MGFGAQPQAGWGRQPHTQPIPKGKGFGDRDNKSEVYFKNRLFLQADTIFNYRLQWTLSAKKSPAVKAGESKSDKAKSVRKYTKKRSGCQIYNYQKKSVFIKRCSFAIPIPKPLSPGKGLYYWGYRPVQARTLAVSRTKPLCKDA